MTGHLLASLCLLAAAASALPAGLLPQGKPWAGQRPTTETPYTKPTNIPPAMPTSCADRPEENDYLMIIHPLTCTRFIVCKGPYEWDMACPAGLYFDYEKQYCNYPKDAHCDKRPGLPSTPPRPSDATTLTPYTKPTNIPPAMPTSCADRPEENDYLMIIHPLTCTRFIVCKGPYQWEMKCPAGLYFDYKNQYCNWPGISGCDERPGLPFTPPPPSDPVTVTIPSAATGYITIRS